MDKEPKNNWDEKKFYVMYKDTPKNEYESLIRGLIKIDEELKPMDLPYDNCKMIKVIPCPYDEKKLCKIPTNCLTLINGTSLIFCEYYKRKLPEF